MKKTLLILETHQVAKTVVKNYEEYWKFKAKQFYNSSGGKVLHTQ